jgi:chromosome segregation ATPase
MSYYVDPVRLESDQKDLLISELKAENFELRNKERHYNEMYDNINGIEHECSEVSEIKRGMEEEMRNRSDHDGAAIRRLRESNEGFVLANRDYDAKIAHIRDEIAHQRAINDSKAREIVDLHTSINVKDGDNHSLSAQNAAAKAAIDNTVDNIMRNRDQNDHLNRRINGRSNDIADKIASIDAAEADMARLNDNISKARLDQDKLRCRLDDELDRNNRFSKENANLVSKGNSLVCHINDMESKCANRDAEIAAIRDEIERLKHLLAVSEDCIRSMKNEIDDLHQQNIALNSELADALASENYVNKDRMIVNKRDQEEQARLSFLMLSEAKSRSRSPVRR